MVGILRGSDMRDPGEASAGPEIHDGRRLAHAGVRGIEAVYTTEFEAYTTHPIRRSSAEID